MARHTNQGGIDTWREEVSTPGAHRTLPKNSPSSSSSESEIGSTSSTVEDDDDHLFDSVVIQLARSRFDSELAAGKIADPRKKAIWVKTTKENIVEYESDDVRTFIANNLELTDLEKLCVLYERGPESSSGKTPGRSYGYSENGMYRIWSDTKERWTREDYAKAKATGRSWNPEFDTDPYEESVLSNGKVTTP